MKRIFVPVAFLAAGVLVFAVVNATAKGTSRRAAPDQKVVGATVHVVEHAITDAVTNGESTDAAGNILTFANPVYDATDHYKVGSDQGYCVRIVVGKTWECNWTTYLPGGKITVEGPFSDTGNTVIAITGGTGNYKAVSGYMELNYHNVQGTKFDFVFHL